MDKGLTIDPTSVYALEGKGLVLYELGHYGEALVSLDKALELDPSAYDALNDKGLTLTKLGDYTQALSAFNIAIEANPYDSVAYFNKALTLDKFWLQTLDSHESVKPRERQKIKYFHRNRQGK